jgi:hypothetical protein
MRDRYEGMKYAKERPKNKNKSKSLRFSGR